MLRRSVKESESPVMSCVARRQQELAKLFCGWRRQHKHKDMLYMKSDFKSYTQIYIYLRECVCVRGTQDEEKKKQAIYRNQIKAKLEPSARRSLLCLECMDLREKKHSFSPPMAAFCFC